MTSLGRKFISGIRVRALGGVRVNALTTASTAINSRSFGQASGAFQPSSKHEYRSTKAYQGEVKAIVLDWAGTVLDYGVYAPAVVFIEVFAEVGVPISMAEAREPMGKHKKVHIRAITQIPAVRQRWIEAKGSAPTEADVGAMFERFVPLQLACLGDYTDMIPGAVETVRHLQTERGLRIGSSTGFTTEMCSVLKEAAAAAGYVPDTIVAADEVPQARPFPFMVWENAIRLECPQIASLVKVDDTCDGVMEGVSAGCWSVALAKTGNYVGLNEAEVAALEPEQYDLLIRRSYRMLGEAGAHYVIDDITGLPPVIDDINRRLRLGEKP